MVDETYTRAFITNPTSDGTTPPNFDQAPQVTSTGVISQNNPFSLLRYGVLAEATYNF